ncbi:beta-galactoside-binding lectin-like [Thalassophryne amazonica]|uniref:beta-galactoside-binding lectin-like n=1 Tax=Thalassophryne amazonica TaxID=390379 RepID=UPI001470F0EF|nr:beta-galactoside-binding lectin-like [Thalassophryne amazonica]
MCLTNRKNAVTSSHIITQRFTIAQSSTCLFVQGMVVKNMSFKVGQTLTVIGVPNPDATNFSLNIGPNETDIAIHINPRFNAHGDEYVTVCNSFQGGSWCEEFREGGFPFKQGEKFKIAITFTPAEFHLDFSDGSQVNFPNRIGANKYNYFNFGGDVRIKSIEVN